MCYLPHLAMCQMYNSFCLNCVTFHSDSSEWGYFFMHVFIASSLSMCVEHVDTQNNYRLLRKCLPRDINWCIFTTD